MHDLTLHLRHACRALWRSPGFTWPMVLILGLGLGANVAFHGILRATLWRPLPVQDPSRVVEIHQRSEEDGSGQPLSMPQVEDLRQASLPFEALVPVVKASSTTLHREGRKIPLQVPMVGEGWQRLLGLKMALGRGFTAEEERQGALVMVLGHRLWRTAFRGDRSILGQVVTLDKDTPAVTVVGVAAEGFEGLVLGVREDAWMPLASLPTLARGKLPDGFFTRREMAAFQLLVRLRPGMDLAGAQATLDHFGEAQRQGGGGDTRYQVVEPGAAARSHLDRILPQRALLMGASALALLLAGIGASGLFAARALRRSRELATSLALGAGTADLARPLALEALLLALLSLPVALGSGLLLARRLMLNPGEEPMRALVLPSLDGELLVFGLGLSLVVLGASVLMPLLRLRRLSPAQALAEGGGRVSRVSGAQGLVILQVALALVLLVASSLALGAFRRMARTGFPTAHRVMLLGDAKADKGLPERLLSRVQGLAGVECAALALTPPMVEYGAVLNLKSARQETFLSLPAAMVGPGWFQALGVPLLEGREVRAGDGTNRIVVNASYARQLFPSGGAVGQHLRQTEGQDAEIVGVVADHRMRAHPDLTRPSAWISAELMKEIPVGEFCILVKGRSDRALAGALRGLAAAEAPDMTCAVLSLDDHIATILHPQHQSLRLLGTLGLGSLLLACFGLWAALSLQVALRNREFAIRTALGATASQILQRVLALGGRMLGVGLGAGLLLAWLLVRVASSRFPDLKAPGWMDLGMASLALLAAGLLACLLPALRASRVEPAQALRSE